MTDVELQDEELEVLLSIYDGDEAFKQLDSKTFQYKYGETDDIKSFLIEIKWGDTYPTEKPIVNMDTFYNKHVVDSVKENIKKFILEEAEQYLGAAMTYTLFEAIKEKIPDILEGQPESFATAISDNIEKISISDPMGNEPSKKAEKKEQLTKSQKRRQWDRSDGKGEKPRGWDWVDIVKHLSQTGSKEDASIAT